MEDVKMMLFARWLSTCYADEHLDDKMRYTDNPDFDRTTAMSVLNRENGYWYMEQIKHFNDVVYPNYIKNGTQLKNNNLLIIYLVSIMMLIQTLKQENISFQDQNNY